ncbi:FAD/NAD(P)-binding domain-containing protein [Tothia fuscella]|uniref:FAD/NAD(P)-binding domain-containing protein n=1 Tax=Tothia fuscella TaxID=1048955 RepID=A0A9P4NMW1_9PEZI|nr:FAD/NAD(P)-binding domain-containing protein [Tothia fuscella]
MSKEPFNIVILGASFAGLSAAHNFLRKTIDELGITRTAPKYRVVLISPSTHLFWNIGAPRAIVGTKLIPHSKSFTSIEDAFRDYPKNRFSFIQGSAIAVDFSQKNVTIANQRQTSQKIPYHALILATGTSTDSPLLSLHGPHEKTIAALNAFHARLRDATSIIIAGGGPSGVECAGQLATYVNGGRGAKKLPQGPISPTIIILISGNSRLLPRLPEAVSDKAEQKLKRMGVNVMHNLRLLSAQELPSGATRCVLSDDLSMQCDSFVAATGVHPNTSFLPTELLDASGYISADPQYLRVGRAGDRVYAIGDCAAYSKNSIMDVYESISPLIQNLKNDLLTYELKTQYPFGGAEEKLAELEDLAYEQNQTITQLLPITRFGGVGVIFGHRIPSFLVHLMKGKDYGFKKARSTVGAGHNPYKPNKFGM